MAAPVHSWKKRGFTTREAASYIGRSPSWLRKKRLRGLADPGDPGPRWLPTEGGTIYLIESLDEGLNSLARKAGPEPVSASQSHLTRPQIESGTPR